jgi:hypothetical protein
MQDDKEVRVGTLMSAVKAAAVSELAAVAAAARVPCW